MKLAACLCVVLFLVACTSIHPLPASTETELEATFLTGGPINFPEGFMTSIKDYGAKGDGVTDDTAAILRALRERGACSPSCGGTPVQLYFPAGTYLVSDTLDWQGFGCCITLQGQGSRSTIIRLKNNAPGFSNPARPKAVIRTENGNEAFNNYVVDMAISTGRGNAGAVGLDFISSNGGLVSNVRIYSEDGSGVVGLAMTRNEPGPLLIKNVAIFGFAYGVDIARPVYNIVMENVSLARQQNAGIRHEGNSLTIRKLYSNNQVPALQTSSGGSSAAVTLLGAVLRGGRFENSAIQNLGNSSLLYLRDITTTGYNSALEGVDGINLREYLSDTTYTLFNNPARASLNLPVRATPSYQDTNLDNWIRYTGNTDTLQSVLNSGKATVYMQARAYSDPFVTVTVPDTVKRIIGFDSRFNGGIRFIVESNSTTPLIIERVGYGVSVDHKGKRPVVLKSSTFNYLSQPGVGSLFLEDVVMEPFTVQPGQSVWARQLNMETDKTRIINNGGQLWIAGFKIENRGTLIDTRNNGKTELLGGFVFPALDPGQDIAFRSSDSQISLNFIQNGFVAGYGYRVFVEETRNGVTRRQPQTANSQMSLFIGY
jgi:hypothetical protein